MDFGIITIAFVYIVFIGMLAHAFCINKEWAHKYEKLNKDWFEIATAQSNAWAKFCFKMIDENNALKKRVKELEAEIAIEAEE